jgi:hypothetical protein
MKIRFCTAAALLVWATAAAANDPLLAQLDLNRDGRVGVYEAARVPSLGVWFVELDQDENAQLDAAEFARFEALVAPLTAAE